MEAIRGADYIWFSHGHPDHLNAESFALLRESRRVDLERHNGGLFDTGAADVARYTREFLDR